MRGIYLKDDIIQVDKNYSRSVESKYKRYEEDAEDIFPKSVLEERIQSKTRVLDLSYAFGLFLKLCDECNLETRGLDISDYAIRKSEKITKARPYLRDINDMLDIFSDKDFDLVTMFDIIEHIKSTCDLLTEVHRVLKRGAKIVITTPNVKAITKLLKGNHWVGFSGPTHLYLFTLDSLRFLVEKNGFIVMKLETIFHCFPKFLRKILNRTGKGGEI